MIELQRERREYLQYLVFLGLMAASALCPFLAWQAGVAYITWETGDPAFHLAAQGLAAWGVLRNRVWSLLVYGLLALYATADLVYAIIEPTNTPRLQIFATLALIATTIWGVVFVMEQMEEEV